MTIHAGATRTVIVTKRFAWKFPRFYRKGRVFQWSQFLQGMLANLQERYWARFKYPQLCPIYFADPLGLLVVMPRCEAMSPYTASTRAMPDEDFEVFSSIGEGEGCVPIENVVCNFGFLNGQLVSFDYGS